MCVRKRERREERKNDETCWLLLCKMYHLLMQIAQGKEWSLGEREKRAPRTASGMVGEGVVGGGGEPGDRTSQRSAPQLFPVA